PVGGVGDLRRSGEGFEELREEPLEPDDSAVAGEPALVSLAGDFVDSVGRFLGAVVLPELGPGERCSLASVEKTQGSAVATGWEHRATGEVDAYADDFVGRGAALTKRRSACDGDTIV